MLAVTTERAQMLLCKLHDAAASHEERLIKNSCTDCHPLLACFVYHMPIFQLRGTNL